MFSSWHGRAEPRGKIRNRKMSSSLVAVFETPYDIRLQHFSWPRLQPGEVLVRNELCTICGSDLHTYEGRRGVDGPTVLGHEILGRGQECSGTICDYFGQEIGPGDRIIWSLCASCGQCPRCQKGLPQKCFHLVKYGHQAIDKNPPLSGGLATHCQLLPGTTIFRISEDLPDEVVCPASCATATIAAVLRHAGSLAGRVVFIQGAGMLGLTACAMARTSGAEVVLVTDIDPNRLQMAQRFGVDGAIEAGRSLEEMQKEVEIFAGKDHVDVILELSGSWDSMERGLKLLDV